MKIKKTVLTSAMAAFAMLTQASVVINLKTGSASANTPSQTHTLTNLGGTVTLDGSPVLGAVDGTENAFSTNSASGSIRIEYLAVDATFSPDQWNGGNLTGEFSTDGTAKFHYKDSGLGVNGVGDSNLLINAGQAIMIKFDLGSLNLAENTALVLTQVKADTGVAYWKRTDVAVGTTGAGETFTPGVHQTITDGDLFAVVHSGTDTRLEQIGMDIIPIPEPSTVYNIEDYGADGTDQLDDTAAIQMAVNAAGAAGGGVIRIPAGTFYAHRVTLTDNITVRGDDRATSILSLPTNITISPSWILQTPDGSRQKNITLSDLTMYGNQDHYAAVNDVDPVMRATRLHSIDNLLVERCTVEDFRTALLIMSCSYVTVRDCLGIDNHSLAYSFYSCDQVVMENTIADYCGAQGYGFWNLNSLTLLNCEARRCRWREEFHGKTSGSYTFDGSKQVKVINCLAEDSYAGGWWALSTVDTHTSNGLPPVDIAFYNCIARNNAGSGISMRVADRTTIENCMVTNNGTFGIEFLKTHDDNEAGMKLENFTISNSLIADNGEEGILLHGVKYGTIHNCDILNNSSSQPGGFDGIRMKGKVTDYDRTTKRVIVAECTISGANQNYAVRTIEETDHVHVLGCDVRNNTQSPAVSLTGTHSGTGDLIE
ncbi:hypothetical protein PDESU_02203 [Pontiella desulfatans]|uniref:Uncharacterized protein n=1 Tax=Pontiella desulfatans TaxID=2750659 RepID=A0A6C2U2N8_PONDE|nr:right-handed parallel beta-helix repeat-containing protein [Pontiella desulfatans]VGO13646.1 hypothetical protein PDESU_02203 [Pontiella desulfatans]